MARKSPRISISRDFQASFILAEINVSLLSEKVLDKNVINWRAARQKHCFLRRKYLFQGFSKGTFQFSGVSRGFHKSEIFSLLGHHYMHENQTFFTIEHNDTNNMVWGWFAITEEWITSENSTEYWAVRQMSHACSKKTIA